MQHTVGRTEVRGCRYFVVGFPTQCPVSPQRLFYAHVVLGRKGEGSCHPRPTSRDGFLVPPHIDLTHPPWFVLLHIIWRSHEEHLALLSGEASAAESITTQSEEAKRRFEV